MMTKFEEFMKSTDKQPTVEVSYQRICYAITAIAVMAIISITMFAHAYSAELTSINQMVEEDLAKTASTTPELSPSELAAHYSRINNYGVVGETSYSPSEQQPVLEWDPAWLESLHVEEHAKQEVAEKATEAERREQKLIEDCPLSAELQWIAHDAVQESDVISLSTFFALMEHESGFQEGAISATDDYGLCQINSCTIPYLYQEMGIYSVDELLDGETNIRASIALLEYTADYASTEAELLSMYHMGVGGYEKWSMTSGGYATTPALEIIEMSAKYEELD